MTVSSDAPRPNSTWTSQWVPLSMSIVIRTAGYYFSWHGGEYIHVADDDGRADPQPYTVINVWDYEGSKVRIPITMSAMLDEVLAYIAQEREDQQ